MIEDIPPVRKRTKYSIRVGNSPLSLLERYFKKKDYLNKYRHVIVTGAAHGIGLAIVKLLIRKSYSVWALDNNQEYLNQASQNFNHKKCHWVEVDITQFLRYSEWSSAIPTDMRWLGLVNNAAQFDHSPLDKYPLELWDKIIATNLTAPFRLVEFLYGRNPHMKGSIVNMASTRAQMSEPHTFAYSASKGGLLSLTHSLAMSMGPKVRVNAISPGWIHIPGVNTPEPTQADHAWHAAGRVGTPKDIAHMVEYLLSEKSEFITGQNFVIDGGVTKKMVYPE